MTNLNKYFPPLIVAATAFLVYANTMLNGFAWDDKMVLASYNWENKSLLSVFGTLDVAKDVDLTPYYRPLTYLSFLLEYRFHGSNPSLMHLANTCLHGLNALLVYLVARSVSGFTAAPLLAGLLFAVHPLNTESVAFLSGGRNTMLAACFAMAAYLAHCRARESGRDRYLALAALFFAAAMFSKESSLAVLLVMAAMELRECGFGAAEPLKSRAGRLVWYLVPLAVYFLLRSIALASAGVSNELFPELFQRLIKNAYIIPRYLLTVFWPPAVSIWYEVPELSSHALLLAVMWLAIAAAVWWFLTKRRNGSVLFGMLWFLMFWLPVSGIIPFPSAAMADRYLYLPAIGLWIVMADTVSGLMERLNYRKTCIAVAACFLLVLAAFTIQRNTVWKNDITLFSDYVRKYPNDAMGHHNLGTAYMDIANDFARADQEFTRTLMIDPYTDRVHTQMGYIRLKRGDLEGALLHYDAAVNLNPLDSEAHLNRGQVLEMLGRQQEALEEYRRFMEVPSREFDRLRPEIMAKIAELEKLLKTD